MKRVHSTIPACFLFDQIWQICEWAIENEVRQRHRWTKEFRKTKHGEEEKKTSTRMQAEHSAIGGRLNHTRDFTLNNTLRR